MGIEAHYPVEEPSLLDHFIQSSPDPAFIIDCQGRVIIWNRAMETLTGVMAAEITGQGGYAHSYAIYKERRPILADIMLRPELESDSQYGKIVWYDNGNSAETENETRDPSRHLWAKASLLKDLRRSNRRGAGDHPRYKPPETGGKAGK